jgi:hypothetical protein
VNQEPEFVAETLAWCNDIRADQGREPLKRLPKGKIQDPFSCPCGEATGLEVDYRVAYGRDGGVVCDLPLAVQRFVVAFDNCELPQYVSAE